MDRLTSSELTVVFLALAALLLMGRMFGELAKRFKQPPVIGEIFGGILLGPTVIGRFYPALISFLFPTRGPNAIVLDGMITLAGCIFLFAAGMEVNLSGIKRQRKSAVIVSIGGIVLPFILGITLSWYFPRAFGREMGVDPHVYALFIATALSISALPVIAKTLMDLNLYDSDFGSIIISAAAVDDVVGWIIFAAILKMIGVPYTHGHTLLYTIFLTLAYAAILLTIGRWIIRKILQRILAAINWPIGVLGFAVPLAFLSAAYTEWVGIHAFLGSFLFGVALGDSSHLQKESHAAVKQFALAFFAPIFFVSIGLKINFIAHFDWALTLIILSVACVGKVIGCGVGAKLGGKPFHEALAIGFGMNSRGAMEIVLGLSALQYGLISERIFVSLVVMAIVTSVISGPMMRHILAVGEKSKFLRDLETKPILSRAIKSVHYVFWVIILFCPVSSAAKAAAGTMNVTDLDEAIQKIEIKHPGKSGAYVLEKGEESLLARAWLGDHAEKIVDIQYFIWSTDNIGILASEALIRAADRGVHVRVLVDDFRMDASAENLLIVASHPLIDVRIYNPQTTVGVSRLKRYFNTAKDFRALNQRMHDKTFIVDGSVAITGGRNMADEYYDYDHAYNFRDRDILVMGPVVKDMEKNFETFWNNALSIPVETLLKKDATKLKKERIATVIQELHAYARNPENFADEVRVALNNLPEKFSALLDTMTWDDIQFIHDRPGKNEQGWYGGGETTQTLVQVLQKAKSRVIIQSPYLVMPKGGLDLFKELISRGVKVSIVTNSLASTDNPYAFSGYSKQRQKILDTGIDVYEYRPNPAVQRELFRRYAKVEQKPPVFAIHAKTLVVDGETLFVGTFNLDPRSANLNTEVGILISNPKIAGPVEQAILNDMRPENSWNARLDNPDSFAPRSKRLKIWFKKLLPMEPLL
jgi:putative cardiolipin synthase